MTRLAGAVLFATVLSACGTVFAERPPDRDPISAEVLGPVLPGRNGNPPIECRDMPRDHCEGPGTIEDGIAGISRDEVQRVVVSCESDRCDADGGLFRIDVVVLDGSTQEVGAGGYGNTEGPPD